MQLCAISLGNYEQFQNSRLSRINTAIDRALLHGVLISYNYSDVRVSDVAIRCYYCGVSSRESVASRTTVLVLPHVTVLLHLQDVIVSVTSRARC